MQMRFGAVFRSYAKKREGVSEVVDRAIRSAYAATKLSVGGQPFFERILFLVPVDHDCGETADRLREAFRIMELRAEVITAEGDPNSDVLNGGAAVLDLHGLSHVAFLSNKALPYLTAATCERARREFLENGNARVVGVLLEELGDVAEMPIQNTFAFWNIRSLLVEAGGFDSSIGCEEVVPLARLTRFHGPCAVLIRGAGELDVRKSAEGQAHHASVKGTKRMRQEQEAARVGVTLEWLNQNIAGDHVALCH